MAQLPHVVYVYGSEVRKLMKKLAIFLLVCFKLN